MQFTEPAEVEDLVGLLRSERMQEVATAELLQWAGTRRGGVGRMFQPKGSVFGSDLTVARLFASSPPSSTYTVEDEDLRDEYIHPQFTTSRGSMVSKLGKGDLEPRDSTPLPSRDLDVQAEQVTSSKQHGILSEVFAVRSRKVASMPSHREAARYEILFYLPDRSQLRLHAPPEVTASNAIQLAVKQDRRLPQEPELYELRLHDEDGLPDEDCPAIDRDTVISQLVEGSASEVCLCFRPGVNATMYEAGQEEKDVDRKEPKKELEETQGIVLIKVSLPEDGTHTTLKCGEGMQAMDILSQMKQKQKIPFMDDYYFVSEGREIGMHEKLLESGLRHLELRRKQYADAPSMESDRGDEGTDYFHDRRDSAAIHVDNVDHVIARGPPARFDPDNFLFNDHTAALYEEWNVIKTNKWGKRQSRVLGIDFQKVYNKKQDKDIGKTMLSNQNVKRRERAIGEIRRLHILAEDQSCIQIYWKDANSATGDVALKYEVEEGPEAAAYIVAKLKYIINSRQT